LNVYVKSIVKWYANIFKRGISVVDGMFVAEMLDRDANSYLVRAIKCEPSKPSFELVKARVYRNGDNPTWSIVQV
jgi:hypothetical protein